MRPTHRNFSIQLSPGITAPQPFSSKGVSHHPCSLQEKGQDTCPYSLSLGACAG
ncbi:rCG55631 [Rattus norvegicus]|uniref:RCG55631 n=1 Tax=Rattus norvegicus TaxID=10116 RepID=A6JQL6_RAT|nr:rCG55631 [Rattus norvegicus]